MKTNLRLLAVSVLFALLSCDKASDVVDDAKASGNLRNVTLDWDSLSIEVNLPDGWQDFEEASIPESFRDAANYGFIITQHLSATNNEDASAKFDGMDLNTRPDTTDAENIQKSAEAFEIPGDTSLPVVATGTINLATHKHSGFYLLNHLAYSNPMDFELFPTLKAKIAGVQESWDAPSIPLRNVPATTTPQVSAFLRKVLELGLIE